jgi:hypothetical protein
VASYSAVIDLRVNGLEQLKEIEDRVKAVQNIQKRLKPIPSIFDKRASAEVKAAKEELSLYVQEVAKGTAKGDSFSKTMAGLNAQMRAFNTVAANSNAGSDEFIASITAAEKASRKLTEAEIDRLQVLSKIYTQQQGIGKTTATQEIIDLNKIIPKSIAGLELYEQQLREAQRQAISGSSDYRELAQAIAEVNRQLDIARGIGPVQGPALPPGFTEAGATGFPRSPLSARPKTKTGTSRKGSPLVGAAFPALFGAGPAGILGGFVGEFFGPLGGVVGSALGAPVDAFIQSAADVGKALQDPIASFDELREKALLASKSQERYIEKLIEAGRVNEAAATIQEELVRKIGVQGVKDLQNAGAASEELNRAMAELGLQMQAAVAGPLAAFISWLADVVSLSNQVGREAAKQTDIFAGLSAEDQAAVKQQEQQILSGMTIFNEAQKREEVSRLYRQYEPRATIKVPGATTDQTPALRSAAQTAELQNQVELAGKQLTLVGLTLEKDGARYIEAAKAVALQEYNNKLTEIQNSWIGKIFDKEKNLAMIRAANLQYAAKLKSIDIASAEAKDAAYMRQLSLVSQTFEVTKKVGDYDIERARVVEGESAALQTQLEQNKARLFIEEQILAIQLKKALSAKGITDKERELLQSIYTKQLQLLKDQSGLKAQQLQLAISELNVRRQLAALESPRRQQDISQSRAGQIAGVEAQLAFPFGGDELERINQQQEQSARYYETITPLERELADLQLSRANLTSDVDEERRKDLDQQIAGKQSEIQLETQALNLLSQKEKQLLQQQQVFKRYKFIADEMSRAFSDSITGLITGTTTVSEAFGQMFENIGKAFINMVTEMLAQAALLAVIKALLPGSSSSGLPGFDMGGTLAGEGIFTGGGPFQFRAEGGPVSAGQPYVVGEKGPELFVPGSSGNVVPNDMFEATRSAIGGGGGGSAAFDENREALNSVTTLNRERQVERLLTSGATSTEIRYSRVGSGDLPFVTEENMLQATRVAAQEGARLGQARTLAALKNNPGTRRSVGI